MKNKFYFLLIFCCSQIVLHAQAPIWQWVKGNGSSLNEGGFGITTDVVGNSYITGSFESATLNLGGTNLSCSGNSDFFIAKYSATGVLLWAKSAGGAGYEGGVSIAIDAASNLYVSGFFASPTITFGTTTLTNSGGNDIFLVKYNANGNVIWAKKTGGVKNDDVSAITIDAGNTVYMTGSFISNSISFGTTTLVNTDLNAITRDFFVAKFDTAGNAVWAKSSGGAKDEGGKAVKTDAAGNVYITGVFYGNITFGTTTLNNTDVTGNTDDLFLVKYSNAGTVLWAKKAGGFSYDEGYSLAVEPNGNTYVTGAYDSPNLIIGTTLLTNAGFNDAFILKYNASGDLIWAKSMGSTGSEAGNCIVSDNKSGIYLTGYFDSFNLIFGSTTLTNLGDVDVYVTKFDTSGTAIWAKMAGGSGSDICNNMSINAGGFLFLTGMFNSPTADFAGVKLTNASGNKFDIFSSKLGGATGLAGGQTSICPSVIYPNPCTGIFNIENEKEMDAITITDILGKTVFSKTGCGRSMDINITDNGIYLVTVNAGGNISTTKVVVNR